MRSLIRIVTIICLHDFTRNPTPKFDPNAEESGKIWDFRSFNYNMYWLLCNMYSEIWDLGQEVFMIRVTFSNRMK